ncbi:flagellar assembly protein FliH [Balneatrix alpica]|uniref:flagellar assembly protein FliH n=1 Tax=Balneatrix alpica TaxID=75684 RepID=UPI002738D7F9|nr:flagellar assembly protein FliH [Balneatrix alpica]
MGDNDLHTGRIPAGATQPYQRWELPQVGDSEQEQEPEAETGLAVRKPAPPEPEPEPEEEEIHVEPLTLEQLEEIRQDAWNEGYQEGLQSGHAEGLEKGLQEGRAQGHEQAYAAEVERITQQEQRLQALVSAFAKPIDVQDKALVASLGNLVEQLVVAVLGHELVASKQIIPQLLERVLAELPDPTVDAKVRVHPEDEEALQQAMHLAGVSWQLQTDEQLHPGGLYLQSAYTQVDARLDTRLEQVLQEFRQQHQLLSQQLPDDDSAHSVETSIPSAAEEGQEPSS